MNICYVLPGFSINPGGGFRIVYQHAKLLRVRGHTVYLLHPLKEYNLFQKTKVNRSAGRLRRLLKEIKTFLLSFDIVRQTTFKFQKLILLTRINDLPFSSMLLIPELAEEHIPRNLDILVATWWETAFFVESISSSLVHKKFFLCQHYEIWGGPEPLVRQAYEFKSLNLICVSKWVHDEIIKRHNRESEIIINGPVFNFFPYRKKNNSGLLKVGYIFRDTHSFKGYDVFRAINIELLENKNIHFLVAGLEPPADSALRFKYVRTNSLRKMRKFYNLIDVLLFSSTSEGFGLPIIESMACGTPVISTPVGIAPEIIIDTINSFLVPEINIKMIVDKIIAFSIMTVQERKSMSEKAINTSNEFKWDKQINLLENIFKGNL